MGRTEKEIPEEIINEAQEHPEMQEQLAAEAGVSKKTLRNRIKKVNLQTSFVADTGDSHISQEIINQTSQEPVTPVDYDAVAKSAVWMLDGMGLMVKNVGNQLLKSKGKEVDYEVMSQSEKEFMVSQLKSQPEALNYLAQNDFMMPVLAFGSILATFVMHFKIKDKEEKKESKEIIPKKPQPVKPKDKKIEVLKENIKVNTLHKVDELPDARNLDKEIEFLD